MRQWKKILNSLSIRQRIAIAAAVVMVGIALVSVSKWRREADFRPLYSGLAPEDASAVVARLKESGVEYRLSEDGRQILVPSAKVAESRLQVASAGLPKSGRIGFELFDSTNFGATEFTEHINYGRALEGELERSIMCLAAVERARVHLTFAKESVFLENRRPAKASVVLKIRPGVTLTPQNVLAVSHLVASAVEGLTPDSVSVVDIDGNLLSRGRKYATGEDGAVPDSTLEFRQSIEKDLLSKINNTLEPLLGPDKYRASVSVDCDFSSGEQSEETFDPARSVMVTSQKTEDVSGSGGASGVPGTASNLPRPSSRPGSSQSGFARRTENITYQSSRVVRRMTLPIGNIRRMSVAVIVDQGLRWEGKGNNVRKVLVPPSPERLKSVRDLVAGTVGFNVERGDQLIVESLPFESTLKTAPPEGLGAPAPAPSSPLPAWLETLQKDRKLQWIVAAGAGLFLLVITMLAWVVRRKRNARRAVEVARSLPAPSPEGSEEEMLAEAEQETRQIKASAPALPEPVVPTKKSDILADRLRQVVKADPTASTQVLRTWLAEDE
ncbi:MAG: flagellar basal-body MS-ring/collar protein FliF [Bryobacteraceae bacterium]